MNVRFTPSLLQLCSCCLVLLLCGRVAGGQTPRQVAPDEIGIGTHLFIGKNDRVFLCTAGGLYLSDNFGDSWRKLSEDFNNIYFHPHITGNAKGRVFLWDQLNGIYSSPDNGDTWERHYYLLPGNQRITAFAAAGDSCFIAVDGGLQVAFGTGLSTTTASVAGFSGMEITALLASGNVVVAGTDGKGLFVSEDRGKTWTNRTPQATAGLYFTTLVLAGNTLGQQWRPKNTGLKGLTITDLHLEGSTLYATTDSYYNVYKAKVDSAGWQLLNDRVLGPDRHPESIVSKGTTLLLGTHLGLFKSPDGGVTWKPSYRGVKDEFITSFQVDRDSTVWATSSSTRSVYRKRKTDSTFSFFREQMVSLSSNIGETLVEGDQLYTLNLPVQQHDLKTGSVVATFTHENQFAFPKRLVRHPQAGFFLGAQIGGVWRYGAAGTWENYNAGLASDHINDLVLRDTLLYAATANGLFKSGVRKARWEPVVVDATNPAVHRIFTADSLMIAGGPVNTFISYNLGKAWQPLDPATPYYFTDVIRHNNILFAAGTRHVYYSTTKGRTWQQSAEFDFWIESLVAVNDTLYLGTVEDGIMAVPLRSLVTRPDVPTGVEDENPRTARAFAFPNPTRGLVHLEGIPAGARPVLTIWNSRGVQVGGAQSLAPQPSVDLTPLPPGLYYLRLQSDRQVKVFKVWKSTF
ncbi:MAG: T9SS type A sorting domain-containing protein [Cytophagales bacterium]|nr:T9SS type A sorting domain-containing protein [Cytophagales bacterium]